MHNFDDKVPFDPGYEKFYTVFPLEIYDYINSIKELKSLHKIKFEIGKIESQAKDLITQIAGAYLGCMLWGSYIHYKFKNCPKDLSGNITLDLSDEDKENIDYANELNFILEFIKNFDKDTKYFLKKPFKIESEILEIINDYKEFIELNNNFKTLSNTKDIKIPKSYEKIASYSEEDLEAIYENIKKTLNSDSIKNIF